MFPGEAEVKFLVDFMNKYDPDYDDSVWIKPCMKKMPLAFELFNSIKHCQMTQYTIEFRFCGVDGCHICGIVGRSVHTQVNYNGEIHKELLRWFDIPVVNPAYRDHFLSPVKKKYYIDKYDVSFEVL